MIFNVLAFTILFSCIFISYTIIAIPNEYDSTAVVSVTSQSAKYKKILLSEGFTDYVDQYYGFESGTTKAALKVTTDANTITVRARTDKGIKSKKIVDVLVNHFIKNHKSAHIKTNAIVENSPSSPNLILNGLVGALIGCVTYMVLLLIHMVITKFQANRKGR